MPGDGPFLWLSTSGPPSGYWALPPSGLCLSVFLFLRRGGRILLGKYADDPAWERLTGLDEGRRRAHGKGWTLPASHLKYGEDPRDAARRVAREVLGLADLTFTEPRVETDLYVPARFPELGNHYDVWFLVDAEVDRDVPTPPWYAELAWHDPGALPPDAYARGHEDVVTRWMRPRGAG